MLWLVWVPFMAFFTAHSLFWTLGIFNSMGLSRVMVAVLPLAVIIASYAVEGGLQYLKGTPVSQKIWVAVLIIVIMVFPFSGISSAISWPKDVSLTKEQMLVHRLAKKLAPELEKSRIVYSNHYIPMALNRDPFDTAVALELKPEHWELLKPGDYLIWDDWFAVTEGGYTLDYLQSQTDLLFLFNLTTQEMDRKIELVVFKKLE